MLRTANAAGNLADRVTIDSAGRVGIAHGDGGILTPLSSLHIRTPGTATLENAVLLDSPGTMSGAAVSLVARTNGVERGSIHFRRVGAGTNSDMMIRVANSDFLYLNGNATRLESQHVHWFNNGFSVMGGIANIGTAPALGVSGGLTSTASTSLFGGDPGVGGAGNFNAGSLTIRPGRGTGSGSSGDLIFQTGQGPGGTATAAHTVTTRMTIGANGVIATGNHKIIGLETIITTNTATVEFVIPQDWRSFRVTVTGFRPTAASALFVRVRRTGQGAYDTGVTSYLSMLSGRVRNFTDGASSYSFGEELGSAFRILTVQNADGTTVGMGEHVFSVGSNHTVTWGGTTTTTTPTQDAFHHAGGRNLTIGMIDRIQFLTDTGQIAQGNFNIMRLT